MTSILVAVTLSKLRDSCHIVNTTRSSGRAKGDVGFTNCSFPLVFFVRLQMKAVKQTVHEGGQDKAHRHNYGQPAVQRVAAGE